ISLSLMKLPMLVEQLLPFSILACSMMTYTRLNRRSELPIIRASGISAWRFLTPVILLAAVLGILTTTVINPLGSRLAGMYEHTRASLLQGSDGSSFTVAASGIWLRQGDAISQIVIHANRVEENGVVLADVKLIEEERLYEAGVATEAFVFTRRIDAKRARLLDGFWQLEDITENVSGAAAVHHEFLSIPTNLDPDKLLDKFATPNTIGFWSLRDFINQTQSAGLDASRYKMRLQSLLALPVLFVAMSLIGALVCLRLSRLGGTSQLIAFGALMAILLFFTTQLASSLGSTGAAPPVVAAWSPALFALFTTLALVAYREDG
ncbi:MAG: LptF/LptG family permease, partial [Hyphomonadaceae bacterium]